jgi:hypothetical protein
LRKKIEASAAGQRVRDGHEGDDDDRRQARPYQEFLADIRGLGKIDHGARVWRP